MSSIICLVGAGGKTTIMYELANYYASLGKKVLVTTSTHIWKPKQGYCADLAAVQILWNAGRYAVVGLEEAGTEKLVGLPQEKLQLYKLEADVVLMEADGAKGKTCKAPRENEPVILPECDTVIGVIGLDALGCSIEGACFRITEVCGLLGVGAEHILDEADLAKIILSEQGLRKAVGVRKYYVVLNKCDSNALLEMAESIRERLIIQGVQKKQILIRGSAIQAREGVKQWKL